MDSTSATLLHRLREPADEDAWNRFVRLYTPLLFYWAYRSGLNDADAADLVQDVFCVLVRKLPTFEYNADGSFRAWLRTVLVNTYRNSRRAAGVAGRAAGVSRRVHRTDDDYFSSDEPAVPDGLIELEATEYRQHLVARALELM